MDRELLLLGLLRRQDMHGYQLAEYINQTMASCVDIKKSTIYFLLDKMAESGWIVENEVQEGNRPPRRVFQLTVQGEAVFQRLLRENLAAAQQVRFAGDIGLAFLDSLPHAEAAVLLKQRRAALAQELLGAQSAPAHPGGSQFVVEHLILHLQTELVWLDEILQRLNPEKEK